MVANLRLAAFLSIIATVWTDVAFNFNESNFVGYKFNESEFPFVEFRPWDISTNGAIELYFQTSKQNALILYQDDGEGKDWIDVFLVKGTARLRLRMGTCERANTVLNGNFTDSKWHHLSVERHFSLTSFSIDGEKSDSLKCEKIDESPLKPKPSKSSLYLGGIPLLTKPFGHWTNPNIFHEAQQHRFTGCIARVRYRNDGKKYMAKYKSSSGITADCQGACKGINSKACKNGGKCLDMLSSMRCDCRGTGFKGMYCDEERTGAHLEIVSDVGSFTNSTPVSIVNTTWMVSAHAIGRGATVEALCTETVTLVFIQWCLIHLTA